MMARYIDADKVEQGKFPVTPHRGDYKPTISAYMFGWNDAIDIILNMAAEDVAPVFYSSWNERGDEWVYKYDCSNCGHGVQRRTPYCPFCGANMDKTEEGSGE